MEQAICAFFFEPEVLEERWARLRNDYANASPFPHVVIDDFLPLDVVHGIVDEFPSPKDPFWFRWNRDTEVKLQTTGEVGMGPLTRQVLNQFNSSAFLDFLEVLTGIEHLVPDPHFLGGGLHQIESGGFLKIHADFNTHPRLELERRLNVLLYLNEDWPDSYGGDLEFWDHEMRACVKRVKPILNRCVIFSTTSTAFHGHPEPLNSPADVTRKSLALYYYTKNRPTPEIKPTHTTLFQRRPGEQSFGTKKTARQTLVRFVPPVLTDAVRSWQRRTSAR